MFRKGFVGSIFALVSLCAVSLLSAGAPVRNSSGVLQSTEEQGRRIRPPGGLNCSRNDLTSFTGRVLSYTRGAGRINIRMRTDEETTERFTLRYGAKGEPLKWFLLRAEPFRDEDWKLIESRPGRLRPGMRATVWVCNNSRQPVIDWQPPER